jgi:large subunit ribosomal protein L21
MYAIVETGGKQYKVEPKSTIKVEKLEAKIGDEVILTNVLMVEKMGEIKVGSPFVKNARIKALVTDQDKHKKVINFKYKPKKRVRIKNGHRQPYTQLKVNEIITD